MSEDDLAQLQRCCDALIEQQQSVLMATLSPTGEADISYAPYLRHAGSFYIFISQLARHTQNLLAHPQASLLFIEPEAAAKNPFARQRLTFRCSAQLIAKEHADYPQRLSQMTEKFGNTVDLLRSLPDFRLIALTPLDGLFVAGFGKAMTVDDRGCLTPSANSTD
jgi:putative heme iron utilization protein